MIRNANTIAISLFSAAMAVALAYIAYTALSASTVVDQIIGEDSTVTAGQKDTLDQWTHRLTHPETSPDMD